jgi:hypothetical protein
MIRVETKDELTENIARLQADIQNVITNNQLQLQTAQAKNNKEEENLMEKSAG